MLSSAEIRAAVQAALAEDVGSGDVTTLAVVPEETRITAVMVARERLVLAGLDLADHGETGYSGENAGSPALTGTH